MRSLIRQFDNKLWPTLIGSVVVYLHEKNVKKNKTKKAAGHKTPHCRDGPVIFHMRDGPPGGTGPPLTVNDLTTGSDPPKTKVFLENEKRKH